MTMRVGKGRAVVMFVDNRAREIYGQLYLDGHNEELDERIRRFSDDVMESLNTGYRKEAERVKSEGRAYPPATATASVLRTIVSSKVEGYAPLERTGGQ